MRGPGGRIRHHDLGRACPRLTLSDGSWSGTHGSWFFQLEDPAAPGKHFRHGGYAHRQDAEQVMAEVRDVLACAEDAADPMEARRAISAAVHGAIRTGRRLPDPRRVRDRVGRGLVPVPTLTVGQWLTAWLAERADLRPSTVLNYRTLIGQHLIPGLGDVLLENLRPRQVREALTGINREACAVAEANLQRRAVIEASKAAWRAHDAAAASAARQRLAGMPPFRRPAGPVTVQRAHAVLRSALSEAVRRELVAVNAAKLVRQPTTKRPRPLEWTPPRIAAWKRTGERPSPVMVWTPAQTRRFLNDTAGHRLSALYLLLAYTGMRRGEACGLHWTDIDLRHDDASVHSQLMRIGTETIEGPPKTDAGIRTIALARPVHDALTAHRLAQHNERRTAGPNWAHTDLVFTRPDGSALNPADVSDIFDHLVRNAGLPPIRLHDLRHGAATHALDAGVPVKVVADLLGHSSTTVTLDLYATVTDRSRHAAANAIAHQLTQ